MMKADMSMISLGWWGKEKTTTDTKTKSDCTRYVDDYVIATDVYYNHTQLKKVTSLKMPGTHYDFIVWQTLLVFLLFPITSVDFSWFQCF